MARHVPECPCCADGATGMTVELSEKERKTLILALVLYKHELRTDLEGMKLYAETLSYTLDEVATDYQTDIVPLAGRLSRPDYIERKVRPN
jgi:hypothetical protein